MKVPRVPRDMEGLLSLVLLVGVATSFVLILAGFALALATAGPAGLGPRIVARDFLGFAADELGLVAAGALTPRTLVTLGLMVLMLTPYVRVLSSVVLFATRERDRAFTLITLFVLILLTATLVLA